MQEDLLHRVELCRISPDGRQALDALVQQAVSDVLEKLGLVKPQVAKTTLREVPKTALRAEEAAAYIGVGRSTFYTLVKEDLHLLAASFTVGRCRMWLTPALDEWMQARRCTGVA